MTPQLVDRAHTHSYIVIGCNLVQPCTKMNMLISGCCHIAVALQLHHSHCEQRFRSIHRVKGRHRVYGHDAIAILWV